jgi:hypothetical protein
MIDLPISAYYESRFRVLLNQRFDVSAADPRFESFIVFAENPPTHLIVLAAPS